MMKRILTFLFILSSLLCFGQYSKTTSRTQFTEGIGIGSKDTARFGANDTLILTIARDSVVYYRYKGYWKPLATGGDLSTYTTVARFLDSLTAVQTRIQGKLTKADADTYYPSITRFLDSLTNVQARIQTKQPLLGYTALNKADSLSGGYASWDLVKKKVDSLGALTPSISAAYPLSYSGGVVRADTGRAVGQLVTGGSLVKVRDSLQTNINLKVNISDTASMLANRLKISDTTTMLNGYQRKNFALLLQDTATAFGVRPLNNRFLDSIATIRALANTKGLGTVTSLATNTGSGITGGTITTTGTIAADTSVLSTKANVTALLLGKQNTLTNPITGTSVSGRLAYWNGTSSQTGAANLTTDGTSLTLNAAQTNPYTLSNRGGSLLTIQSQTSGSLNQVEYYTKDGDGTDNNGFAVFGVGTPSVVDAGGIFEQFRFFYNASNTSYTIGSNVGSTGSYRDFRIGNTLTPTDLIIKATSGRILINTATDNGVDQVQANGSLIATTLKSTTNTVSGNSTIAGTLGVTGATTLSSTLSVTGAQTNSSSITLENGQYYKAKRSSGGLALDVLGYLSGTNNLLLSFSDSLKIRSTSVTDLLTVASNGNTTIGGTLGVTGATTLTGDLTQNGNNLTQSTQRLSGSLSTWKLHNINTSTSGSLGWRLPAASSNTGRVIYVFNSGNNPSFYVDTAGENIKYVSGGSISTATSISLLSGMFVSDGTDWILYQ